MAVEHTGEETYVDRREMMKKTAIVGTAAWVAPAVVPMGSGTAGAANQSPTCIGCLGLVSLQPGNSLTGGALNIAVNSNVDFWCGCGCFQAGTYVWSLDSAPANCTLDVGLANSANSGTGSNVINGTITTCGTPATASLSCTTTLTCKNPDGRSSTYSSTLGVNATWKTSGTNTNCGGQPATGTQVGTVTYDPPPANSPCKNRSHSC